MVNNPVQDNCVNKYGTSCEGLAPGRSDVISSGHPQTVTQQPDDKLKFQVASLNVGTMHGRSGEVVETMSWCMVDVCCLQEVRWRGASARLIQGKDSHYRMFWVGSKDGTGGVAILLAEKWTENVIDVNRVK